MPWTSPWRAWTPPASSGTRAEITHLIVTSCTGFYAPGLDLQLAHRLGLDPSVERTIIGFMGCYAAMNALKLARHIVRSEPRSKVAIVNLELCTLHLQETDNIEEVLSFLIFADGCSASIVSAEPDGIELESFRTTVIPGSADQITWHIGRNGFDMRLAGTVPGTIGSGLPDAMPSILNGRMRARCGALGGPSGRTLDPGRGRRRRWQHA